jgi:hypothetical protein
MIRPSVSAGMLLAMIVGASAAGCSGSSPSDAVPPTSPSTSATPAPVATEAATPTPSPSPDVATLFASQFAGDFAAAGPIVGTISLGNLEGQISGVMAANGGNSAFQMMLSIPEVLSTSSYQIRVDGKKYESNDGGPFFEVDPSSTSPGLSSVMTAAALTAKDDGIVSVNGEDLHHMVPASGNAITAADLGMSDPSMADATGTLDFYARDDGSLALMSLSLTWDMAVGEQQVPASMAMDFTFNPGDTSIISAPDQVWTRYASDRFDYSVGYPIGWGLYEAANDGDWDVFAYSPTEYTAIARDRLSKDQADNLAGYVKAYIGIEKKTSKAMPETSEAITALGGDAWRLTYHRNVNGDDLYSVHTLFVRGQDAYQVFTFGPTGSEADIDSFHEIQLGTLSLTGD